MGFFSEMIKAFRENDEMRQKILARLKVLKEKTAGLPHGSSFRTTMESCIATMQAVRPGLRHPSDTKAEFEELMAYLDKVEADLDQIQDYPITQAVKKYLAEQN